MSERPVDWNTLAALVRKDRGDRTQHEYAAGLGLAQPQVSALETRAFRVLSGSVALALLKRFGDIPRVGDDTERGAWHDDDQQDAAAIPARRATRPAQDTPRRRAEDRAPSQHTDCCVEALRGLIDDMPDPVQTERAVRAAVDGIVTLLTQRPPAPKAKARGTAASGRR